jgi:glycosyltransferase involved in cell wall biosynthesis
MNDPGEQTEKTAVLIPCYNEELTVAHVVKEFREALPEAQIYVFDNVSTDRTAQVAKDAGAIVVNSPHKGKGYVVRHMFETVDADWLIMVDGDATYPPGDVRALVGEAKRLRIDMLVGCRCTKEADLSKAYRPMHQAGNQFICWLVAKTFDTRITDIFSGYRIFSREFVETVPLHAKGFQIEAEMTLQALSKNYRVDERPVEYLSRPQGSQSKLNTWKDGFLVLATMALLYRNYRPGLFFSMLALGLLFASLLAGIWPVMDYLNARYVFRVPLAILATGLGVLSALSFCVAAILQTQLRYHNELHALLRRNFRQSKSGAMR